MSHDVWMQDLPAGIRSLDDIPEDFVPQAIGSRADFIRTIVQVVPWADFSDPARGSIEGPDFSIEISMSEDPVQCCHLILRGSDRAVGIVVDIVQTLGLPALHSGGDGVFRPEDVLAGFQQWRPYRDQIVGANP